MPDIALLADFGSTFTKVVAAVVGGATTDVHSIASGAPGDGLVARGLPEPVARRTVEGDPGVGVSAISVLELAQGNALSHEHGAALGLLENTLVRHG